MLRPTIRGQILIPVLAVQAVAAAVLAVVAATSAARRVESQVVDRLEAVLSTLHRSSFPINAAVLEAMKGLSGADFVAIESGGAIRETTLPGLRNLPDSLRNLPSRASLEPPGRSPTLELEGRLYFAASVREPGRPTLLVLYPELTWRNARWSAAMPPIAVGLGAVAITAAITGLVAHRLGRRLRSLEEKTAAIASGDFRPLDPGPRSDEIGDLTASINRMCLQLKGQHETIRRTERAGVLAQIAAGLAHGLRNAATGARMAVQLHARRCPVPNDESLDVALRQLALSEQQVKALLALGRPETPARLVCEARSIVEDVADLVSPMCSHAHVSFRQESGSSLKILADIEGLRSAVLNLTLNAIEAAGAGGSVELSARQKAGGFVVFEVIDTGSGPPAELADSLFEPFVTSKPEGVGLGLAVARQVALDHQGTLSWVRDVDDRTRFVLSVAGGPS
jgi:signal transduction histidine kinase